MAVMAADAAVQDSVQQQGVACDNRCSSGASSSRSGNGSGSSGSGGSVGGTSSGVSESVGVDGSSIGGAGDVQLAQLEWSAQSVQSVQLVQLVWLTQAVPSVQWGDLALPCSKFVSGTVGLMIAKQKRYDGAKHNVVPSYSSTC